jgi:hypothetical protein
VVVISNAGHGRHPAWWLNLGDPRARARVGGSVVDVMARELEGPEETSSGAAWSPPTRTTPTARPARPRPIAVVPLERTGELTGRGLYDAWDG